MALRTLTVTGLRAIRFSQSQAGSLRPADLAELAHLIKDDDNASHPTINGALDYRGILTIPNRWAFPRLFTGDVVAVDQAGWPILISRNSLLPGGGWSLSGGDE
jgi:hypothetical protein